MPQYGTLLYLHHRVIYKIWYLWLQQKLCDKCLNAVRLINTMTTTAIKNSKKNRFYFKLASTECFIVAMAAYFSRPLWHTRQHINTLLPNLVALGAPSHWNVIIVFIEFIQLCNKQKIFHTDNDVHRIRVHSFVTLWTSKDQTQCSWRRFFDSDTPCKKQK